MSTNHNQQRILEFYAAFDNRQIDQALEMLAPNFVAHMAGMPDPLDGSMSPLQASIYTHLRNPC
ncbi:nuclear transport factor 2 family protein [Acaryochloris sp. CCMEE 5410]|uniref:nuclear transport factor 2 family protein n=1 Tax=Acaryochloris sp. CCMEE 5410 TaxID=310037 RepID=UPI0002DA47A1|nr:nuclear transport factor 2 family protein [Acaryochloris sp. CCMEE 5410]KAI9133201.1 nuclear transport factor 2 family protein [Acaryochloris sp. CCMEE 5410]